MSAIWISLLQVEALPGTEYAGEEAYVNAVVPAGSAKEAESVFAQALLELGWRLVTAEDLQEFSERCAQYEVDDEIKELARVAASTGMVQFHTFHTWVDEHQLN